MGFLQVGCVYGREGPCGQCRGASELCGGIRRGPQRRGIGRVAFRCCLYPGRLPRERFPAEQRRRKRGGQRQQGSPDDRTLFEGAGVPVCIYMWSRGESVPQFFDAILASGPRGGAQALLCCRHKGPEGRRTQLCGNKNAKRQSRVQFSLSFYKGNRSQVSG